MTENREGLTPDDIARLQAPLPLAEHEARAKGKSAKGDKQQWLIYINQEGVIPLLNSIDPNWTWEVRETVRTTKYVTVTGRMTLKGVSRDGTGGSSPNGTNSPVDEDTEKGAETDALKRAAVKFGIGLYLRGVAAIWLPYSEASKSWELEKQALAEFEKWYRKEFSAQPARPTPPQPTASPASTAPTNGSDDFDAVFPPPPPDAADTPPNQYRVTQVKVVPQGNSHLYLLKAGDTNITLYGGDLFRKIGQDPEYWKSNPNKWFAVKPTLTVVADFDGEKWHVAEILEAAP